MKMSFEDGCIQLEHRFFHMLLSQADVLGFSNAAKTVYLTETGFVVNGRVVEIAIHIAGMITKGVSLPRILSGHFDSVIWMVWGRWGTRQRGQRCWSVTFPLSVNKYKFAVNG
jgi:hypothetical protein